MESCSVSGFRPGCCCGGPFVERERHLLEELGEVEGSSGSRNNDNTHGYNAKYEERVSSVFN